MRLAPIVSYAFSWAVVTIDHRVDSLVSWLEVG
jgi:hypothetical protein